LHFNYSAGNGQSLKASKTGSEKCTLMTAHPAMWIMDLQEQDDRQGKQLIKVAVIKQN
jgi:hypothetical protein